MAFSSKKRSFFYDHTSKQAAFVLPNLNCPLSGREKKRAQRLFPAAMIASILICHFVKCKQTSTYRGQEIIGIGHGDQMHVACARVYVSFLMLMGSQEGIRCVLVCVCVKGVGEEEGEESLCPSVAQLTTAGSQWENITEI